MTPGEGPIRVHAGVWGDQGVVRDESPPFCKEDEVIVGLIELCVVVTQFGIADPLGVL